MRGAGLGLGFVAICFGIIPACAGSRICNQPLIYQLRDNPRVCGEQVLTTLRYVATEGSSPRVRGAVEVCNGEVYTVGIIPACAGSSGR